MQYEHEQEHESTVFLQQRLARLVHYGTPTGEFWSRGL